MYAGNLRREKILAGRREDIDHVGVLEEPRLVLDAAAGSRRGRPAHTSGARRTHRSPSSRRSSRTSARAVLVGGRVGTAFIDHQHDHLLVPDEHRAGDLVADLLFRQVLEPVNLPWPACRPPSASSPSRAGTTTGRPWRRSRGRGARLRLGLDGGAPLRHQPLLAVTAARAGRLRHPHVAGPCSAPTSWWPPFYHPVRLAEDVAMLDVMSNGPLHARHRHRLQARRVRALRRRAREARRPLRGAAGHHEGPVDPGADQLQGHVLHGRGPPRAQAGDKPHPPVWIGGWGDITLRRAATWPTTGSPGRPPTSSACWRASGSSSSQSPAAGRRAHHRVAADARRHHRRHRRRARELAEEHIMVAYRREYAGGWRHPFIDASSPPTSTG